MHNIYLGEIWRKTHCLQQEQQINQAIKDLLINSGWSPTDHFRIWQRENRQVVVCLVDDIRSCSTDYHTDMPYLFDKNTVVVTDNYLTCPTRYRVVHLPVSFFGIYSFTPENTHWNPDRDFAFQVNRIDTRRFQLMLDLFWRCDTRQGYINFNCFNRQLQGTTAQQRFQHYWSHLGNTEQQKYQAVYEKFCEQMPYKNYNDHFDSVACRAWLNIIIETYASDTVISVSEKIFRALVTPAPWTVYSGRYTVAWLESLGFDCMSDIVDHNHYDRLKEIENKLHIFNWKSLQIAKHLQILGIDHVRHRSQQAAQHNRELLEKFAQQRLHNFEPWLKQLAIVLE